MALVKNYNPNLAAAALDAEEAAAKIYPAGALDDPTVSLSRDEGFRQTMLSVSQEFPLWGKRSLRRGVAEANARSVRDRQGSLQRELEEQLKVAFAQYYAADRALAVTHDIHTLLDSLSETVRTRYAQGLPSQSDAIRADLERTKINSEFFMLERDSEAAKAKINALIGRSADSPLAQPTALRGVPPAQSLVLASLLIRARDQNPMFAMAAADIQAAQGEVTLAEKSWYPDVTVSVGADDLPGMGPRATVGVGIKIPLQGDLRRANEQAASAKASAARARLAGTALQVESELKTAIATLTQTQQNRALLNDALRPQTEAAYRSALASYENTRGDLTAVIEAAHQQIEVNLELLRAETEEQTAFASVERLAGGGL
ncbi:MAG TPA: TolC family protein [Micropepsaceae bacterium]|nr:TolC family protein [Micropepsaceae bacterium]